MAQNVTRCYMEYVALSDVTKKGNIFSTFFAHLFSLHIPNDGLICPRDIFPTVQNWIYNSKMKTQRKPGHSCLLHSSRIWLTSTTCAFAMSHNRNFERTPAVPQEELQLVHPFQTAQAPFTIVVNKQKRKKQCPQKYRKYLETYFLNIAIMHVGVFKVCCFATLCNKPLEELPLAVETLLRLVST